MPDEHCGLCGGRRFILHALWTSTDSTATSHTDCCSLPELSRCLQCIRGSGIKQSFFYRRSSLARDSSATFTASHASLTPELATHLLCIVGYVIEGSCTSEGDRIAAAAKAVALYKLVRQVTLIFITGLFIHCPFRTETELCSHIADQELVLRRLT